MFDDTQPVAQEAGSVNESADGDFEERIQQIAAAGDRRNRGQDPSRQINPDNGWLIPIDQVDAIIVEP